MGFVHQMHRLRSATGVLWASDVVDLLKCVGRQIATVLRKPLNQRVADGVEGCCLVVIVASAHVASCVWWQHV